MEDLKKLTNRVFRRPAVLEKPQQQLSQTPPSTSSRRKPQEEKKAAVTGQSETKNKKDPSSSSSDDDDNLMDDIEDKNASFNRSTSSYLGASSTQNSSRSGGNSSSNSGDSNNPVTNMVREFTNRGLRKRKATSNKTNTSQTPEVSSVFSQLVTKFTKMLNQENNHETDVPKITHAEVTPGGSEEPISFVEQMRLIKEASQQKVIFQIDDEEEEEEKVTPGQTEVVITDPQIVKLAPLDEKEEVNTDDEGESEEYDEEYEDDHQQEDECEEERREPITHCIHRLPSKGQKVNLDLYYDVVMVDKVVPSKSKIVEPLQKKFGGFLTSLFNKGDTTLSATQPEELKRRYFVFYEGRLLVVSSLATEQLRNYGSHFNVKDKDKLQMPRITWNGQIHSSRSLRDLLTIRLINYKQVLQKVIVGNPPSKDEEKESGLIRMQLEWRKQNTQFNPYRALQPTTSMLPIEDTTREVKTYLIDRFGLQVFIQTIQRELLHERHLNVKCIIT